MIQPRPSVPSRCKREGTEYGSLCLYSKRELTDTQEILVEEKTTIPQANSIFIWLNIANVVLLHTDIQKGQNMENQGEIILYQPNKEVKLEVRLENETVWLNRQQLAELFARDVKTIRQFGIRK